MYGSRIQYALDNFIQDNYFLSPDNLYHLKEEEESGKSDLKLNIDRKNLCIEGFDKHAQCEFVKENKKFGMKKSVDHIFFEKGESGWRTHLIEMKSIGGDFNYIEENYGRT